MCICKDKFKTKPLNTNIEQLNRLQCQLYMYEIQNKYIVIASFLKIFFVNGIIFIITRNYINNETN